MILHAPTEHPAPWRLGRKLHETYLGPVSIYDGTRNGDDGQPGRFVGVMFTRELGEFVVAAINQKFAHLHSGDCTGEWP